MTFVFTAPSQKVATTGFRVDAVSRAGVTQGVWDAGLGTDWSGRISVLTTNTGDAGAEDLVNWSNSSVTQITATLKDREGWAYGHTEVSYVGVRRQKAPRGGSVIVIFDSSDVTKGTHADEVAATVEVLYPATGTYAIRLHATFKKEGKAHHQSCSRNTGCQDSEQQLFLPLTLPGMEGKLEDPNHLQGLKTETKTGLGRKGTGTVTTTVTWDLARQGTGK